MRECRPDEAQSGEQWVSDLMNEMRANHASVPADAFATLEGLLHGRMAERNLSAGNLKQIAELLILQMDPKPPEEEGENED